MDSDELSITQKNNFVTESTEVIIARGVLPFYKRLAISTAAALKWLNGVGVSALILGVLLFIVINFYLFSSIVNLDSFFYGFIFLSLLTDGLYIALHLPRKKIRHQNLSFDPAKLTIVIACYNGEKTIAETIRQAAKHIPVNQIVVVSDASSDRTAEIARQAGVKVIENPRNMHKAFSVSIGMKAVKTPYVLILDDDTLIGDTFIPTSLLDDGYDAVAFKVIPLKEKSLINELQQFEYLQSMQLGKDIRAEVGAIGNISGAIGLFRTDELVRQVTRHSGQFAGEDEQRTLLVHLHSKGKGITYTDAAVYTKAPDTYLSLYRQRAYKWSAALPEMFTMYWQILLSPRFHYLLKAEKAYQLYYYFTDPLRLLFFWMLLTRSSHLAILYAFYLALNSVIWIKLKFKASFRAVLIYPIYNLFLIVCRFIGHAYWLYVKVHYIYRKLYKYVQNRRLLPQYALVLGVVIATWTVSVIHFSGDISLLNKIHSHSLNDTSGSFNYALTSPYTSSAIQASSAAPADADYLLVPVEQGDTQRAIADKAIIQYLEDQGDVAGLQQSQEIAYTYLAKDIPSFSPGQTGSVVKVDKSLIQQALSYEKSTS